MNIKKNLKNYKEYKIVLKSHNVYGYADGSTFNKRLTSFLEENPNIKIENIIQHDKFDITIIYSILEEVK